MNLELREKVVKMASISDYQMLTVHYNVPASFKQYVITYQHNKIIKKSIYRDKANATKVT